MHGGDKHFTSMGGGTNIFTQGGGEEEVIGGYDEDNVYEEMYVSGASKLSAQARILVY